MHQKSLTQRGKSSTVLSRRHVTSHIIIFRLCWPLFNLTACVPDLKLHLGHVSLCD